MITFGYLAGWGQRVESDDIIDFIGGISDTLSYGHGTWRDKIEVLADFDAIIYICGYPLETLPTAINHLKQMEPSLPDRNTLQIWNELIFNLFDVQDLVSGKVRGVGLYYPEQRLYGGHLLRADDSIELSISLASTDLLFELQKDIILGLQSLLAIVSNLESLDLIQDIVEWRLTLRPGMLYEEMFNGREIDS